MSTAKSRIVQGRGKVGTRSGVPALKKRTKRAIRHSAKQVLDQLDEDTAEKAEAKLADRTYLGLHPAPVIEPRIATKVIAKKTTIKKKKKATPAATAAKKRAAEALQKELDSAARAKAQRRAKRRAAARALKKAREE
jgi:hypothetical protein